MSKNYRERSGLTLVEVLFAFAILTTLLTLSYGSALSAWRSAVSSNQRTQAQFIAQQAVENLKGYIYSPCFKWARANAGDPGGFADLIGTQGGAGDEGFYVKLMRPGVPGYDASVHLQCPWEVDHTLPGGESAVTIGSTDTDIDATAFTYRLQVMETYTNTATDPPTFPYNPFELPTAKAIGIKIFVSWTNASNQASNLEQSTIIVRPADGPGITP